MEKYVIITEDVSKAGFYDYKKGQRLKLIRKAASLSLVEDSLDFQNWIKNEVLEDEIIDKYKNIKSKENYDKLLKLGMLFEFHPELSGDWEKDKNIIL